MDSMKSFLKEYSQQQRKKMDPSDFAWPEEKKFPIKTKNDVLNSIRGFHKCPDSKKPKVARNLLKAAKKFDIKIKDPKILNSAKKKVVKEARIEAGNENFPLIVNTEKDVKTEHDLVGDKVQITEYADEVLSPYKGQMVVVEGVITKHSQIAGLKVKTKDNRSFYAPKKDFYIDRQYVEDIHLDAKEAMNVFEDISHWNKQHDYYGTSWDGVELLCLNLATTILSASVESAGWNKYPSSDKIKMDGKNWRYVFRVKGGDHGVVECNSVLHDNVWTLNTTTYSTSNIDDKKLKYYKNDDIWIRSMLWVIATAKVLKSENYDYSDEINNFRKRIKHSQFVMSLIEKYKPIAIKAYREIAGQKSHIETEPLSPAVTKVLLPPGKIGCYVPSKSYHASFIAVHPNAFKDKEYIDDIVKHEISHAVMNQPCNTRADNSQEFKQILGALNGR